MSVHSEPPNVSGVESVLLLGLTSIDRLMSGVELVKGAHPGASVDLVLNERCRGLVEGHVTGCNFIVGREKGKYSVKLDAALLKEIRRKKYDLCLAVVNSRLPNRTMNLLVALARARRKGFAENDGPGIQSGHWFRYLVGTFVRGLLRRFRWFIPYLVFKAYSVLDRLLRGNPDVDRLEKMFTPSSSPRVLVFNYPPHVGNSLIAFTLVKTLKKNCPDGVIHMVTGSNIKGLLEIHSCIEKVIYFDDEWAGGNIRHRRNSVSNRFLFVSELRKNRYDVAFDLSVNSWYCSMFAAFAGIRYRIGFKSKDYRPKHYYAVEVEDRRLDLEYEKPQAMQVVELAQAIGINEIVQDYSFGKSDRLLQRRKEIYALLGVGEGGFLLGIHPGADWESKRWGVQGFAQAASYFEDAFGARVIITGGKGEREICRELNRQLGGRGVDLSGTQDLFDLSATISGLDLFLVNNTGPMHIAAALNVPFLGITGPSPVSWDPDVPWGKVIRAGINCTPCDWIFCANPSGNICITEITPETVIREALGILKTAGAGRYSERGDSK